MFSCSEVCVNHGNVPIVTDTIDLKLWVSGDMGKGREANLFHNFIDME